MRKAPLGRAAQYKSIGSKVKDYAPGDPKDYRAAYFQKESANCCLECTRQRCTGNCEKVHKVESEIANQNKIRHKRKLINNGKKYAYKGQMLTISQLSAINGISTDVIRHRLRRGMSAEEAAEKEVISK